jgi:hypothetical protein
VWRFDGYFVVSGDQSERIARAPLVLLRTLVAAQGAVVSRERLWDALYRDRWLACDVAPHGKAIDVYLCRLRDMFHRLGVGRGAIENVWGEGFKLACLPEPDPTEIRPVLSRGQWRALVSVLRAAEKVSPGSINRSGLAGLIDAD